MNTSKRNLKLSFFFSFLFIFFSFVSAVLDAVCHSNFRIEKGNILKVEKIMTPTLQCSPAISLNGPGRNGPLSWHRWTPVGRTDSVVAQQAAPLLLSPAGRVTGRARGKQRELRPRSPPGDKQGQAAWPGAESTVLQGMKKPLSELSAVALVIA